MTITILVTAFEAFPGVRSNPTIELVRVLERDWGRAFARAGLDLRTAILPVVYAGAEARAQALIAKLRPDVVLHLGLAARRSKLTIEACARNRLNVLHPDANRARSGRLLIAPHGQPVRRTRAPVARIAAAIAMSGPACTPSRDAGDYLCNQTFYASLGSDAPCVGFLHIPRPRRLGRPLQPGARSRLAPSVKQMSDATAKAVYMLCRYSTVNLTVFLPS